MNVLGGHLSPDLPPHLPGTFQFPIPTPPHEHGPNGGSLQPNEKDSMKIGLADSCFIGDFFFQQIVDFYQRVE